MTNLEMDAYAIECARIKSFSIHSKIPSSTKGAIGREDIEQSLCLHYLEHKHTYQADKEFKPWVHTVMHRQGINELTDLWDKLPISQEFMNEDYNELEFAKQYHEDGSSEIVRVDLNTPEMKLISYYEETEMNKKVNILKQEVEVLCKQFGIEFDGDHTASFVKVLDLTLNKMTDEEFNALSNRQQLKLGKYGDAMNANNLMITSTGKVRNLGIVRAVRDCVRLGIHTLADVKAALATQGLVFDDGSLRTIVWNEQKRAGITLKKKRKGIYAEVVRLFDFGLGITTVAEMLEALRSRGIQHSPVTIRTYVQQLRAKTGITRNKSAARQRAVKC